MTWRATLFTQTNLNLLRDELVALSRTPYFSNKLEHYLEQLIKVVHAIIERYDDLPKEASEQISHHVWLATKYLSGGTSKTVPYETVYALRLALNDWTSQPCAITTALVDDLDYHFSGIQPGHIIRQFLPDIDFGSELIQIALPKLYRHLPLYNVALYHELGHYVDRHYKICDLSMLLSPIQANSTPEQVNVELNHRREYFADLFASSYTGRAFYIFLDLIAPGQDASYSHPSTENRLININHFLNEESNPIIEIFKRILALRKLPSLEIRYTTPDISKAFSNVRPYYINTEKELHGILESSWTLFIEAFKQEERPWTNVSKDEISRIINDLIEKSIRNWMTRDKWTHAHN